ncbi:serine/threonine-protein kinase [Corallococcus soli]|uniref:serine/threonine-protein kinase n=1 Tax=Corallococcus soli TaxID=2710757 RepID=UPI001D0443A3|nr:serine/threonine-protein kinase [Corallococcus soli]
MSSPQTATPFGKYLLIKRLALGGMAELFLAHKPPSQALVVIKRILPYLSEEPEFVQMFLDEARIAAQLHHPNVVQVHELGKEGDNIFICMEYVEGVDLRRVLVEEAKFGGSMPYGVAARICAYIAAGLDHAHFSRGVDGRPLELIHRDVSPQNVMISYDGRVKLVDFGIAKAGAFMERSKPGVIKGKFLYLSPEQIMQERLDHRADIYALGVMLYEITTGKQPFSRQTTEGILYAIRYEEATPPHLVRPDYPEELSRIVMRCLVKDRTQRYQRAADVRADLDAFLASGVLKQSLDIPHYIARLLGEADERTVLHIPPAKRAGRHEATVPLPPPPPRPPPPPVPDLPEDTAARTLPLTDDVEDTAARTSPLMDDVEDTAARTLPLTDDVEDTAARTLPLGGSASGLGRGLPRTGPGAVTPAGLVARPPARRPTREAAALRAFDATEGEPETQMARPRELPTRAYDEEDEDFDEATAVGTMPGAPAPRRHLEPVLEQEALEDEEEDGDSTVPLRARRPRGVVPAPIRRGGAAEPTPRASSPGERGEAERARRMSSPGVAMPRGPVDGDPFSPSPRRTPPHASEDRAPPPPGSRRPGSGPGDDGRSEPLASGPRRMNVPPGDDGRSEPLASGPRRMNVPPGDDGRSDSSRRSSGAASDEGRGPGPRRPGPPSSDANRFAPSSNPGARSVRAPPRPSPEDDERFSTDPGMSGMSLTDPTPTRAPDPDDDESTIGFQAPRRPSRKPVRASAAEAADDEEEAFDEDGPDTFDAPASPRRSRAVVALVVGAVLVLGILVLAWMMGAFSPDAPPRPTPVKAPAPGAPPRPGPTGAAPVTPPAEVPADAPVPKPSTEPALAAASAMGEEGPAGDAPVLVAVAAPAPESPAPSRSPPAPATVQVRFDAPARTVLGRPGGEKLPVNQVLAVAPGPLRVQYTCPGKRILPRIETYNVRPGTVELQTLRVPCRRRR